MTSPERVAAIVALRRLRLTAAEIAEALAMPLSTVSVVLRRVGLGKRSRLQPLEPANRYERRHGGELLHIDVKKLARIGKPGHRIHGDRTTRTRGIGWEYVHVCVDDATRLAYVEVLPDERASSCVAFLTRAVAHYQALGLRVQQVLTDNGNGYRSSLHAITCAISGSATSAPGPTDHAPTAKPNASSAHSSTAGPTPASTTAQPNEQQHSQPGSTSTITADHTAASATNRP